MQAPNDGLILVKNKSAIPDFAIYMPTNGAFFPICLISDSLIIAQANKMRIMHQNIDISDAKKALNIFKGPKPIILTDIYKYMKYLLSDTSIVTLDLNTGKIDLSKVLMTQDFNEFDIAVGSLNENLIDQDKNFSVLTIQVKDNNLLNAKHMDFITFDTFVHNWVNNDKHYNDDFVVFDTSKDKNRTHALVFKNSR